MTLVMYGKTRRRRGVLTLVAFLAVVVSIVGGATLRPAQEAAASDPQMVRICTWYLQSGPVDDLARTFTYHFLIDSSEPQNGATWEDDIVMVRDEGTDEFCAGPIEVPNTGSITVTQLPLAGFQHFEGFPYSDQHIGGAMYEAGPTETQVMTLDGSCPAAAPCKIRFLNRWAYDPAADYGTGEMRICKTYQAAGAIDDFDRAFQFAAKEYRPNPGNAFLRERTFTIVVDEGSTNCTDYFELGGWVLFQLSEPVQPGWEQWFNLSYNGFPGVTVAGTETWLENQSQCGVVYECTMTFINKQVAPEPGEPLGGDYPLRVCKVFRDNEDGHMRPDTTFEFDANGVPFSMTIGEDGAGCTIVYVPIESLNDTITITEHAPANWNNATGYPKRAVDAFPVPSNPDGALTGWEITVGVADGCHEILPLFLKPMGLAQQVMGLVDGDAPMCTVYFVNMEAPDVEPTCEAGCSEPQCEADCYTPACEADCDPPSCELGCTGPVCEVNCSPDPCVDVCDGSTPTPGSTPMPPVTPETQTAPAPPATPQPADTTPAEEDVEGETTASPQATPMAPDTGTGNAQPAEENRTKVIGGLLLLAAAVMTGSTVLASRRR